MRANAPNYACQDESASDDAEDEEGAQEEREAEEEAADFAALDALTGDDDFRSGGQVKDVRSGGQVPSIASSTDAEAMAHSQTLISTFEAAMVALKNCGATSAVANLANEIRKERRRTRAIGNDGPDVLVALARQRDAEEARDRQHRLRLAEDKKRTFTASKLNEQVKAANELLKNKLEVLHAESVLEARHAIKTYSLEELDQGRSRGGAGPGRKRRLAILDRMAHVGEGLSAAQRNDFGWWKDNWDLKMLEEHGDGWPALFAGWIQRVLDDFQAGIANAFSLFVNAETRRHFDGVPGLRVP